MLLRTYVAFDIGIRIRNAEDGSRVPAETEKKKKSELFYKKFAVDIMALLNWQN